MSTFPPVGDVQEARPVSLPLCKVNMSNSITIGKQILAGVKGRVRSVVQIPYSIYIENLKLVCSVQRVSNSGQKVKFNHYREIDSCSGQRSGQVIFNLYRKSKVGVQCAECQTQAKKLNSNTIRKGILAGSKVGSGRSRACALYYLRAQPVTCSPPEFCNTLARLPVWPGGREEPFRGEGWQSQIQSL